MTEKRFTFGYVCGDTGLIDNKSDEWFIENCCNISDLKKNWIIVCDKLNALADENEQLKRNCKNYEWYEEYKRLLNENEQLKKEIENWKSSACSNADFSSILLNELSIAQEQGYEVSDPFKKLIEGGGF